MQHKYGGDRPTPFFRPLPGLVSQRLLKSKRTDEYGRYILLNATVQGCNYIMGNMYAPNMVSEQCSFFEKLQEKFDSFLLIMKITKYNNWRRF